MSTPHGETDVQMTEDSSPDQTNSNQHPIQTTSSQHDQPDQARELDQSQISGSSQHQKQSQEGQITNGPQSGSSSVQMPPVSQDQHQPETHVTNKEDEELEVEEFDHDEYDEDDDIDTKIEKKIRRQRRFKLKTLFGNHNKECVFSQEHTLYNDVLVGILKPQGCSDDQWLQQNHKKTLEEVFESLEKQKRDQFLSEYMRDKSSLQAAIDKQQLLDFERPSKLEYFDLDNLKSNGWLQRQELKHLETPEGMDEFMRKAARCVKIAETFGQEGFQDPLVRGDDKNVIIHRDQENEPTLPYFDRIFGAFDSWMEKSLEKEASHMVYWCQRPTGIPDGEWCELKKLKKDSYKSEQEKRKIKRRKALSEDACKKDIEEEANRYARAAEKSSMLAEAELLNEAKIAAAKTIKDIGTAPAAAMTEYLAILPIIMNWWENDKNEADSSQFAILNLRLTSALGAATAHHYHLKFSLLYSQISDIRRILTTCEELSEQAFDSKMSELGSHVMCLTNELRGVGLDWKRVVPSDTHVRVLKLLRQSQVQDVVNRRVMIENAWLQLSEGQLGILKDAESCTHYLMFGIETDNDDILRLFLDGIRSINARLRVANTESGIRGNDHCVPIAELDAAVNSMPAADEKRRLITTFLQKCVVMKIPGSQNFSKLSLSCTEERKEEILEEVLGLKTVKLPREVTYDVPILGKGPSESSRFSNCAHQKTVGWGENSRSRFYINQYGPRNAPIWRKERYPTPEWLTKYSEDFPPLSQKVTNSMNRLGSVKNGQGGWKYGKSHLKVILGVAWDEDKVGASDYDRPIESLNPIYHDKSRDSFKGYFDSLYILVGWDRDNDGILTYKWEIRETLRRTYGKKEADNSIYKYAKVSQARFDEWSTGRLASSSRSPTPLVLGVAPTNQRRTSVVGSDNTSYGRGMFDYSFSASPPTAGDSRSPTLSISGSSSGVRPTTESFDEDIETAYDRFQQKYPGNTSKQNDLMVLKFGKGWAQSL
jgi:hypothetical protein